MYRQIFVLLLIAGFVVCAGAEKTFRLKDGQALVDVSTEADGGYLLALAQLKQFVTLGQGKKAEKAFALLKQKYPDNIGPDAEQFQKAEMLYARRKFFKAFAQYSDFMDAFPQSTLNNAALERQYEIARAFLYGKKKRLFGIFRFSAYEEAAGMAEKIANKSGDAPIAKKSMTTIARSYEARKKFAEAFYRWSDVSVKWPTGQIGADALLGMAGNLHASYKGPKYDASMLGSSRDYYQDFIVQYPGKASEQGIAVIVDEIDAQIADKQLDIALYYERTSSITAANLYFQRIVNEWPGSAAAKIAAEKLKETKS